MKRFLVITFLVIVGYLIWPSHKNIQETKHLALSRKINHDHVQPAPDKWKKNDRSPANSSPTLTADPSAGVPPISEPSIPISNRNRHHLTAGMDIVVYSMDEFRNLNPTHPLAASQGQIEGVVTLVSQYSGEPTIKFSTLSGDCAPLAELNFAVALRVGADGFVMEAAPLNDEGVSISPEVYNCKFSGGPGSNFVTTVYPSEWRNN